MSDSAPTMVCAQCLRQYRWKPDLAGKRAKCKCGQTVTFPATAPETVAKAATAGAKTPDSAPASFESTDDNYDLAPAPPPPKPAAPPAPPAGKASACPQCTVMIKPGAVICTRCGFNLKTGKKLGTSVKGPGPDGADIARAAGKVVLSMVLGGLVAVIGSIIWIVIIIVTGLQLGFIAWILGLAIGWTMRLINPYGGNASALAAAGFAFLALALPKALLVFVVMKANMPVYYAFSMFDGIWFTLAVWTAYKVGAGLT